MIRARRALVRVMAGVAVLALVSGCAPATTDSVSAGEAASPAVPASSSQARVVVTTDYGAQTIVDAAVTLEPGTTAMQALKSVAEVGTAYSGGFVQSINGIGATRERRTDWFYAVNGILANRGAAEHVLRGGDVEHWDYRQWGFRRNVSATLGCFPSFFLNGYNGDVRPTAVTWESPYESEAAAIVSLLESCGVDSVESVELTLLSEEWRKERNLVVVAGPGHELVREVYALWDKLGLFTRLEGSSLRVYTSSGEEAAVFTEGTGILEAMQNPWNPSGTGACENVVLLVSGTDADGVRSAAGALVDSSAAMTAWCGAVVREGVPMSVPLAATPDGS